ncbi:MAG: class B sortase [Coriobacteriales bacterium]|nr:class B sortase [Coriobacteriales bacterium]
MEEGVARKVVLALRTLVRYALVLALCLPLAMGCYALWDSHVVYERADVTQWQPYKPTEPEPLSFWELQRINPEVRAWLSVYGTNIDYPVCQATPNEREKYLTTDAKGEYSLSGALFMDTANAPDFSDFATIVYGHHMENDVMFGSITNFSNETFFAEHQYGNLFVNDEDYGLEFFCYLDADAYDRDIYRTDFGSEKDREDYLRLLHERARWWRDDVKMGAQDRIALLSTCSSGYTNARAILVAKICNERFENPFVKIPNLGTGVDELGGWLGIPVWCWLVLALFAAVVMVLAWTRRSEKA